MCRIGSDSRARPPSMRQWPASLLDCGVKMNANERAFREVKDGQYPQIDVSFLVAARDVSRVYHGTREGDLQP